MDMDEQLKKMIYDLDNEIRDRDQGTMYYKGMREGFQKARELLERPDINFDCHRTIPRWKFAKQGTKLPAESIIRYGRENDLRLGYSATWDCYYIPVKDLLDLLVLYE